MKDPYETIRDAEENLEDFIRWQVESQPTNNFFEFAQVTGKAEDVFKYAAILYPRFIKVEGAIVLANHYSEDNWREWRKSRDSLNTARMVNHVHVEDFLPSDRQGTDKLEKWLGKLLAFFWQLAVDHQFPGAKVQVEFDGEVIDIFQAKPQR